MDKFITIYFTILLTLVITNGARLTEETAVTISIVMFLGIFLIIPATNLYDRYVTWIEKIHAAQHTRHGIEPYSDWK